MPLLSVPSWPSRRRTYEILEVCAPTDRASRRVNGLLVIVIAISIADIILASVDTLYDRYAGWFILAETLTVLIFTAEYAARLWANGLRMPAWRYALTPMAIIDLLAILPFYLALVMGADLRALKVLRLLRILKLTRYFTPLKLLGQAIKAEAPSLIAALFVLGIMILLAASLMYWAERSVQPEAFGSIPQAMWWSVVTLTTVGYGDVTPVTLPGRALGIIIMVMGIGVVALPAGMLASRFSTELQKRRERLQRAVQQAEARGPLDSAARDRLKQKGMQLGLSEEDVDILDRTQPPSAADPTVCPHCGQRLPTAQPPTDDPPTDDPPTDHGTPLQTRPP